MKIIFLILVFISCALISKLDAQSYLKDSKITTYLETEKNNFKKGEPIIVDIFIKNDEKDDLIIPHINPFSSKGPIVRFFINDSSGYLFDVSPYKNWDKWYQPLDGEELYKVKKFVLSAGEKMHLFHGDLYDLVVQANELYKKDFEGRFIHKGNEKSYIITKLKKNIEITNKFLDGGEYEISMQGYSLSNKIKITIND